MVNYKASVLDTTFAALSDPIRRGILERLARGEATAGELAAPYDVSLPAISRHLRVLEQAGLLARRKTGRIHRCRLNAESMRQAAEWMARYQRFWGQQFDALDQHLSATQQEKTSVWPHPASAQTKHSKSGASSKRRAKKSSARGPKPKS